MQRDWMKEKTEDGKLLLAGFMRSSSILDKNFSSEQKLELLKKMEEATNTFPKPSEDYLKNGMKYPSDFLKEIKGHIIMMPIDWMAEFIHKEHREKFDFGDKEIRNSFSQMLKSSDLYYIFMYMKPQLLGAGAYTVLNAEEDEVTFNSALEFLDLYQKYYVACMLNDKQELSKQVDEHEKWLKSLN